jgi:hypothetical protein
MRRNKPTFEPIELDPGKPKGRAPVLPRRRAMLPATRAWYDTWARSPQASQFMATDWQRLHLLAMLVEDIFRTDDPKLRKELLGELRLQEAKLGATPEDRLRLRWRLGEAKGEEERGQKQAARKQPSRKRGDPRLELIEGGKA